MRCIIILVLTLSSWAQSDDWSPPKNPDPQAILQEARADTRAGKYETALAKHLWFHKNALSIDHSFYGVRLSFALSYWHELAKVYPPALSKMEEIRDQAAQNVMDGKDLRESFHDMTAINRTLNEESHTKGVFEVLDSKNPTAAKQIFDLAQPALVRAKAYGLVAKYLDPKKDFARMTRMFTLKKQMAEDANFGDRLLEFAKKNFTNDVTTLVAILVVNERKAEAEEIALSAKQEWNDPAFHAALDSALKGLVPEPWP
jgi:hypothetical protein